MREFECVCFPPGATIFREGEPGDCAYIIKSGVVKITTLRNRRPMQLELLGEQELFGEMALLDDSLRSATAHVIEETEALLIPRERVDRELSRSDPFMQLLLWVMLRRLRSTNGRLGEDVECARGKEEGEGERTQSRDYQRSRELALERLTLEHELTRAPQEDQLVLRYQPIIDLLDRSTTGYEALLRWQHPKHGLLPPGRFLRFAEDSGLIVPIGQWVLRQVCEALARGSDSGLNGSKFVSVNLSARQLSETDLAEDLAEILDTTGTSPSQLVLEITESSLMQNSISAGRILSKIRSLGVAIFLDDFGTGYSSLSYLNRFPITGVKLDASFVAAFLRNATTARIVRSVAALSRELGLRSVAEGIENEDQAEAISNCGFRYGQGFYFGRPRQEFHPVRLTARTDPV